jgi:hypothetical protein
MTTSHFLMLVIGILALGFGLTMLVKPSITRGLLGMPEGEGSTYALRIGGMMLTAFGLVLVLFVAASTAWAPAASISQGAN